MNEGVYKNYSLTTLDGEEWRAFPGKWKGYFVSNFGRVASNKRGKIKILHTYLSSKGYITVNLNIRGRQLTIGVHRIVAMAFIVNPKPKLLTQVNHKDENKTNNRVGNLEWCDCKYNINYGTGIQRCASRRINTPSTSKKVIQIDANGCEIKRWLSASDAGRNGFDVSSISKCCLGKMKVHKGYKWAYIS